MLPLLGLIPLLPLLGFLLCGLLGRRLSKGAVTGIACGSVFLAFLVSLGAVLELRSLPPGRHGALEGSEAAAGSRPTRRPGDVRARSTDERRADAPVLLVADAGRGREDQAGGPR